MHAGRLAATPAARAALGYALLVLVILGDVLFAADDRVLSSGIGDVAYYFARIRRFAFAELAAGNLPLWNPHLFSGQPLLGSFQAGLLYPPNAIYLVLPIDVAVDLDFALHLFWLGCTTFLWVRGREVHPLGAFFAGVLAMCCGATTLRVLAGQLSLLAANAWTPLVWCAVDRLLERPTLRWTLVGIAATALQILAGYPFCSFATALVAGLTVALRFRSAPERPRLVAALASVAIAPALITAVQLWTGLEAGAESSRGGGVPFWFAVSYELPFENLLTTVAAGFFGDLLHLEYWGEWWFWDASIFLGVPALALAFCGVTFGSREQTRHAPLFAALLLLLTLGSQTPVFELFHRFVPGFDRFRAPSKYAFHLSLFVALLAGIGIDRLRRDARGVEVAALLAALVAVGGAGGALWIGAQAAGDPASAWDRFLRSIGGNWVYTEGFAIASARFSAASLWQVAASGAVVALLLAAARRLPRAVPLLVILAIGELVFFARSYRGEFPLSEIVWPELRTFHRLHPGDHRFFALGENTPVQDNQALEDGVLSVWGYDPIRLERYARFGVLVAKGQTSFPTPPLADRPTRPHPLFALLRCRYWFTPDGSQEMPGALPRFSLRSDYRVVPTDEMLAALGDPGFDPHRTVLLEEEPVPRPRPGASRGRIELIDESTDHATLAVDLPEPALLLVSDAYSRGWRAVDLTGNGDAYPVLPADYILRAFALPAGRRTLRLEYAPPAWRIGRWISLTATAAFLAVAAWSLRPQRKPR